MLDKEKCDVYSYVTMRAEKTRRGSCSGGVSFEPKKEGLNEENGGPDDAGPAEHHDRGCIQRRANPRVDLSRVARLREVGCPRPKTKCPRFQKHQERSVSRILPPWGPGSTLAPVPLFKNRFTQSISPEQKEPSSEEGFLVKGLT